jgi:hypothetical protein
MKPYIVQTLALFQGFTSKTSSLTMENTFAHENNILMKDSNIRATVREMMKQSSATSGSYFSELTSQIIDMNTSQIIESEKRLFQKIETLEKHMSWRIALNNMVIHVLMCFLVTACLIHFLNGSMFDI